MNISAVEALTGLDRTNIRFYEREGFIEPKRLENNYRDYSDDDVELLQKIKLLRRLNFSLDSIKALKDGSRSLSEELNERLAEIDTQRRVLNATEQVCQEMQLDGAEFATLDSLRYMQSFEIIFQTAPSALQTTVPDSDKLEMPKCPWRRFFARVLDVRIISTIVDCLVALIFRFNLGTLPLLIQYLLYFVYWGILVIVEGLLLSRYGTTLGKAILGIRVEHADGRHLSFKEAKERTKSVFANGCGYYIPIHSQLRQYASLKDVLENGRTEWDRDTIISVRGGFEGRFALCLLAHAILTIALKLALKII